MNIPREILEPIEEGLISKAGGEVVVRGQSQVGHVYLYGGAIAWVTSENVQGRLREGLERDLGIAPEDIDAVLAECKARRTNFGETLLAWGLTNRDDLRAALLRHNARHFRGLLELNRPLVAMFLPLRRTYSSDLLFTLGEIASASAPLNALAPHAPDLSATIERLAKVLPDCQAMVAFDLSTGGALGAWFAGTGGEAEPQALAGRVSLLNPSAPVARLVSGLGDVLARASGDSPREIVSVAGECIQVVVRGAASSNLSLVLEFSRSGGPGVAISSARALIAAVEDALAEALATPSGGRGE